MLCIVKAYGLVQVWGPFKTFEEAKTYALETLQLPLQRLMDGEYVIQQMHL